jgi:hypothetical protein
MSRTDKTRPWWVKLADHPMVTSRPHHDHRFGPCTLPDHVDARTVSPRRGCYWEPTDRTADTVHNGCRECTGYWTRREDRRRSRHEIRRALRAYQGE